MSTCKRSPECRRSASDSPEDFEKPRRGRDRAYILTHDFPPRRYVPRKCSATNRIIKAKDHGSVQISVAKVDENGRYTGENQVYALCGFVRAMGESDDCMNRLTQRDGFLKNVWNASGN